MGIVLTWAARYLGLKVIKTAAKAMWFKAVVNPGLNYVTKQFQKYIDDPTTDGDEKLTKAVNEFAKYKAKKWTNSLLD